MKMFRGERKRKKMAMPSLVFWATTMHSQKKKTHGSNLKHPLTSITTCTRGAKIKFPLPHSFKHKLDFTSVRLNLFEKKLQQLLFHKAWC